MTDRGTDRRRFLAGTAGLLGTGLVGRGLADTTNGTGVADRSRSARGAPAGSTTVHREWSMYAQGPYNSGKTEDGAPVEGVAVNWERDETVTTSPVVRDNYLWVGAEDAVVKFDRASGEEVLRISLEEPVAGTPAVDDDNLYVATEGNTLFALAVSNGEEDWSFDLQGTPTAPQITPSNGTDVYLADGAGFVYEVEGPTGTERWQYDAGDVTYSSPVAASPDTERVYALDDGGTVTAVDADSGRSRWTNDEPGETAVGPPVVDDPNVYLGDTEGTMHVVDARLGGTRYTFDAGGAVSVPATFERQRLYVATEAGTLYALDRTDGAQRWQVDLGAGVTTAFAVAEEGLYVPTDDGQVRHLGRDEGEQRWRAQLSLGTPRVAVTGQVFAVDEGVTALEAGDRTVVGTETPTETPTPTPTPTETPASTETATSTATEAEPTTVGGTVTETATPSPTPRSDARTPTPAGDETPAADDATTTSADGPWPLWSALAAIGGYAALGLRDDGDESA